MTVSAFRDLPLAPRNRLWDADAAERRVRAWSQADGAPNARYRGAHLWYDSAQKQNFTAHKLLFADVIGGELTAVPRALFSAAGLLDGARGGLDVSPTDLIRIRQHIGRYYAKMGEKPPWP